jgi:large subunit ribosomal protein L11
MAGSYAKSVRSAVREVVGSCVSMGVKVEGKDAREFMTEIDSGKWDSKLE